MGTKSKKGARAQGGGRRGKTDDPKKERQDVRPVANAPRRRRTLARSTMEKKPQKVQDKNGTGLGRGPIKRTMEQARGTSKLSRSNADLEKENTKNPKSSSQKKGCPKQIQSVARARARDGVVVVLGEAEIAYEARGVHEVVNASANCRGEGGERSKKKK